MNFFESLDLLQQATARCLPNKTENKNNDLKIEAKMISPTILAYIGDAVYELYAREMVSENSKEHVKQMHKHAVKYVSAHAQASVLRRLTDAKQLNEDEADIVRRARNTKATSMPKNADVMEYKYATAFEALIGYLYKSEQYARLSELLKATRDYVEDK